MSGSNNGSVVRAALYARASSDAKGKARSVTGQTEDGLQVVSQKGGTIDPRPYEDGGDLFIDNDIGASDFSKKARKAYLELLRRLQAGQYKMVVMFVEDRTHRQVLELAEFVRLCKKRGIRVVTIGTEYDLDDEDQLSMWFIKVRFAEAEAANLSKRVRRGKRFSAERGMVSGGGRRPFGEQGRRAIRDDDGNVKEVVPIITLSQAMVERQCINEAVDYLLDGGSLRGLTADWNEREIKTPAGKQWKAVHLREMLLSPRLAGIRQHNGSEYPAAWTPIVDPEKWRELRTLLTSPTYRHRRKDGTVADRRRFANKGGNNKKYPLTGILFCSLCGARLTGRNRQYRYKGELKGEYRTYACQKVTGGCNGLSWPADDIERLIFEALFQAVESDDFTEAANSLRADDPTKPHYEALARLTARIDRTRDMLTEYLTTPEDERDPDIDEASLRRRLARLEAEHEEHWAAIDRLRDGRTRAHIPRNLREVWSDLSLDRQKSILAACIESITLYPRRSRKEFDPETVKLVPKNWR